MIALLSGLGSRIWGWLVAGAAAIGLLLMVLAKVKKSGADEVRVEAAHERDTNRGKRDEINRDTLRKPDGSAADRLRNQWSRD